MSLKPQRAKLTRNRCNVLAFVTTLFAGVLFASAPARGVIRIATYNTDVSDTGSIVPAPGMDKILKGLGDIALNGRAHPVDVFSLTELDSVPSLTLQPMVDPLNAIYGAGTYAFDPYVGRVSAIGQANGPNGLIYNTKTVQVIQTVGFGRVSGSFAPREPVRYKLRPVGYGADADFYVYVEHAKASAGDANVQRRLTEAQDVRANADALGPNAHIIYTGDFNFNGASAELSYQAMIAPGNGQAVDVSNPAHNWVRSTAFQGLMTESALDLFGRYDVEFPSNATINQPGLQLIPGTYTVFGNNGTTPLRGSTDTPANTSLASLPNGSELRTLLTTVSDHLPVVADYDLVGVSPIPEPAALPLLVLCGVALRRRRRPFAGERGSDVRDR